MITVNLHFKTPGSYQVNLQHTIDAPKLAEILTQLANVRQDIKEFRDAMKLTDQELTDLLNGIDTTTNATATNVATIGTAAGTIKTELEGLIAAAPAGTALTDSQVTQLQGFATKLQGLSDASLQQATTLQAIAAEGAPVVPAPPATIPAP